MERGAVGEGALPRGSRVPRLLRLGAIGPPIYQTTLFSRKSGSSGYSYTRFGNPKVEIVEKKIAALEEGERAVCFASGMAAISSAVLQCIERDAHIVAMQTVYPGTRGLLDVYLRKLGADVTYVPGTSVEEFDEVCDPDTRVILLESPSSMVFTMVDLEPITEMACRFSVALSDHGAMFGQAICRVCTINMYASRGSLSRTTDSGMGATHNHQGILSPSLSYGNQEEEGG